MTTERAIEVLTDLVKSYDNLPLTEQGKETIGALNKAIEVMDGISEINEIINEVEDYINSLVSSEEFKEGSRHACNMIDFRIKITLAGNVANEEEQ